MTEMVEGEVVIRSKYLGMGHPPGYRPTEQRLLLSCEGKNYELAVFTSGYHFEKHFFGRAREDHCDFCGGSLGQFLKAIGRPYISEDFGKSSDESPDEEIRVEAAYVIYLDLPELSLEATERALKVFIRSVLELSADNVSYGASLADEMKNWEEKRGRWIGWLKSGAPPLPISIAPGAFAELGKEVAKKMEDGLISQGFARDELGLLRKEPDPVAEAPKSYVVSRLTDIATAYEEQESIYLSPGSWPPQSIVVAGRVRHYSEFARDVRRNLHKRLWVAYMPLKHRLIMFDPENDNFGTLMLRAAPDFLEAMEKIEIPRQ